MSKELIDRLREWNRQYSGKMPDDIVKAADTIEQLERELAASQKQNVHLRSALEEIRNGTKGEHPASVATKALSATADLSGYILCEKEPVAHVDEDDDNKWATLVDDLDIKIKTPLYRAREQK